MGRMGSARQCLLGGLNLLSTPGGSCFCARCSENSRYAQKSQAALSRQCRKRKLGRHGQHALSGGLLRCALDYAEDALATMGEEEGAWGASEGCGRGQEAAYCSSTSQKNSFPRSEQNQEIQLISSEDDMLGLGSRAPAPVLWRSTRVRARAGVGGVLVAGAITGYHTAPILSDDRKSGI